MRPLGSFWGADLEILDAFDANVFRPCCATDATCRVMWHSPQAEKFLPSRGHAIVTITVLDENGFTHHYQPVELRLDVLSDALARFSTTTENARRLAENSKRRRPRDRW